MNPKIWPLVRSWHENGVHDQAAMTDYILAATRRPALLMAGHSMSSTAQAVFLAERPEYADRVLACAFMAPPIYFRHPAGMLEMLLALHNAYPLFNVRALRRRGGHAGLTISRPRLRCCHRTPSAASWSTTECPSRTGRPSLPATLGPDRARYRRSASLSCTTVEGGSTHRRTR